MEDEETLRFLDALSTENFPQQIRDLEEITYTLSRELSYPAEGAYNVIDEARRARQAKKRIVYHVRSMLEES